MKKFVAIAVLASIAGLASATEVGLRAGRSLNTDINTAGVTLGNSYGPLGAEITYDRSVDHVQQIVTRWGALGSFEVLKLGPVAVSAKVGAGYIDQEDNHDGVVALAGAGATLPLSPKVSVVADYTFQKGQQRIRSFSGNNVFAGLKYKF